MKNFILHRNTLATEFSAAIPVFTPVFDRSLQALLRFRADLKISSKTSYHARKHSNPTQPAR